MALIKSTNNILVDDPNYHTSVLQVNMSIEDKNHLIYIAKRYLSYPLQTYNNGYGFRAYLHKKEKSSNAFGLGREFGKYLSLKSK